MEKSKVTEFLAVSYGSGDNYGSDDGSGAGSGAGAGSDDGSGYGSGYGSGSGSGSNDGSGSGYGVNQIGDHKVYIVDGILTIFHQIKDNIAICSILNDDLTLTKCFVVKVGDYFAHGETIRQALEDAEDKYEEDLPLEIRQEEFKKHFDADKKYSGHEFFKWHKKITKSCLMGRNDFVSRKRINLDDKFTVFEFFDKIRNDFGWSDLEKLEKDYLQQK